MTEHNDEKDITQSLWGEIISNTYITLSLWYHITVISDYNNIKHISIKFYSLYNLEQDKNITLLLCPLMIAVTMTQQCYSTAVHVRVDDITGD